MQTAANRIQSTTKKQLKSVLERLAPLLPRDTRDAIAGVLTNAGSQEYSALLEFAKRMNVESLLVRGDYGVFQSSVEDVSILGEYSKTGLWAKETNDCLERFFVTAGGGTYVDVGANIGLTTVPVSKIANTTCFALEPEPTNYGNLVANLNRNSPSSNVTALQIAAFNKRAQLPFEIASGNLGDHRIRLTNKPGVLGEHNRTTIMVDAAPLDDIIPVIDGPLAVKIDTQGAEPFIVEGGSATLGRAELLIVEFWPYGMLRLGANAERIYDLLASNFATVSLSRESELIHADLPIRSAIEILREFEKCEATHEPSYFDIFASR